MKGSQIQWEKYIVPAGIVVGGYFLLKNFGLFGGNAGANNTAGITDSTAAGVSTALQQAAAAGDFATISPAQASGYAANIYNAGIEDPADQDTIQQNLIQANTLTDLLQIVKAFGTKQAGGMMCSIFGGLLSNTCGTYNLSSWVRETLDAGHLASVNGYLASQNINYQF